MAGKPAVSVVVTFLGQNDCVDEPGAEWVNGGQPRDFDAAEPPLQSLEQRHEIPHGDGVMSQKQAQGVQPINFVIDGMAQERSPWLREACLNLLQSIYR